jgi:hypothetical protein
VALPARAARGVDRGLGPVAALAGQRGLGDGDGPPGGDRPGPPRARAGAVDGHDRRPDREGRSLWADVPRAGVRGGRTIGTKRTLLVEILGLPVAADACSARPHDVVAARELLRERIDGLPRLRAIVADRAYTGLARLAARKGLSLDIKRKPAGGPAFVPLRPSVKVEHAFAQLGRWRRLSRYYEGTVASARTWLEVASVGYLAWRAST